MLTVALVVMVIFLSCATFTPRLSPALRAGLISGTFGAMYALGYSLDNLS